MRLFSLLAAFFISATLLAQTFPVVPIYNNGTDAQRINYVVLSDGYTSGELDDFVTDATNISDQLFDKSPFLEYASFFNIYAIKVPSAESGADHPGTANEDSSGPLFPVASVDTYFGSTFDSYSIHRLLVPTNSGSIYSVLANNYPGYDQIIVLVNSPHYGGSGGVFATTSLHSSAPEIAIHEIGHSFAGLADEYWAGDFYAAEKPNMTAQSNPALAKWSDWVGENGVGLYAHNGSPTATNWYRPHQNCEMRILDRQFCSVCKERIIDVIYGLTDPIDSYLPATSDVTYTGSPLNFSLDLVLPAPNTLKVEWVLNGSPIASYTDNIMLNGSDLPLLNNTLIANITDTTFLSKSYHPASGYAFSVSWNIENTNLPIDLTAFQAIGKESHVELSWQVAQENEVKKYEIERSEDAIHFEKILEVAAAGSGDELHSYSAIDATPLPGKSYYRLKIIEQTGNFEYSEIRTVNRVEKFFFKIYPNPVQDQIFMSYQLNATIQEVTATLFDATGQNLKQLKMTGKKGTHISQMDISDIPAGVYYLHFGKAGYERIIEVVKE